MSTSTATVKQAIIKAVRKLGYSNLRHNQETAVLAFVKGSDVFISLPTGSGKSLCYWCLPGVHDVLKDKEASSMIVVVSPLMADQVSTLHKKGMKAIHVSGDLDETVISDIYEGKFQVLFFSPEQLLRNTVWRDMLRTSVYEENLVGFVVDEAHCVKKW